MCSWQREQADRKDAVNPSLEARAAPSWRGRFTLLPILSAPDRGIEVCQQSGLINRQPSKERTCGI
ncbi:Uncharacterised protein [Yersinia mollaretii]|nr:Uncharacterised protein [Yersinia mollaretii]CQJ09988.1 Uncharacterised protein [Yersinia mollaretii]